MERFRNTSYIFGTILAAVGVLFSSGPMFGGDRMGGEFKLSEPVHWVDSILPAGDFVYTVDAGGHDGGGACPPKRRRFFRHVHAETIYTRDLHGSQQGHR